MGFDLSIVGQASAVHRHDVQPRDVALYAIAVGAGPQELAYVRADAAMPVLPTYAVIPTLEPCRELLGRLAGGFADLVHRYQKVILHRELPASGAVFTTGCLASVCGRGAMAEVTGNTWTRSERGELISETEFSVIYLRADLPAGEPIRRPKMQPPSLPPDFEAVDRTLAVQPFLYALHGDNNPIHLDTEAARQAGFERPILHGLCTFGYACRAVLGFARQERRRSRLISLEAEFRKPAFPGDALEFRAWRQGPSDLLMQVAPVGRSNQVLLGGVRAVFGECETAREATAPRHARGSQS